MGEEIGLSSGVKWLESDLRITSEGDNKKNCSMMCICG